MRSAAVAILRVNAPGVTRDPIEEHRFDAVLLEVDWPDAYRVNRDVQLLSTDRDGRAALIR